MNAITNFVRNLMTHFAGFIDYWTKGMVKPAHITALSLLGFIPVAWALVSGRSILAAVMIAVFGLLDALDGALARVQKSTSRTGMFFDSVSDRIKEVVVFSALAVYLYKYIDPSITWQVVAAAGTSVIVSFVRARGEAALVGTNKQTEKLNNVFTTGISTYQFRTVAVVVALLFGWVEFVLPLLIAANALTIAERFLAVTKELYDLDKEELKKATKKQ